MAVSVIDTRGEFKLVPYSGDDELWPQWVLKFEAWSELVGWGRQLDAAAASTLTIVNTTLETKVQPISRQLHAILVVKERRSELSSWSTRVKGWSMSCVVAWNSQPKGSLGG